VWQSRFVREEAASSRLFHCDWADTSQVKLFIYATDVDESNGPLVLLDARSSQSLRRQIGYRFVGAGYRVPDDVVESRLGVGRESKILGPAGTAVLADTSRCFHYGSRIGNGAAPRTLIMMQYLTPSAFELPLRFPEASPWQHLMTASMSRRERLLLGLS